MTTTTNPKPQSEAVDMLLKLYDVKITPEHEAAFADFRDHVSHYMALTDQIKAAELDLKSIEDSEPRQPTEVEDWREWTIYTERVKRHLADIDHQKKVIKGLYEARGAIFITLRRFMPAMVWFKVDNLAVGLSYSNWGGSNYELIIKPWGKHRSYNLDQTYRGD